MKFIGLLIAMLLLAPEAQAKAQTLPPPTVWYVGDSVTYDYAYFIDQVSPPTWNNVNLGMGGETSRHAIDRMAGLLASNPAPTIAVISFGTNDAVRLFSHMDDTMTADDTAANLVTIAQMFEEAGTIPIIGLPIGVVVPTCQPPGSINRENLTILSQITQDQRQAIAPLAQQNHIEYFAMYHNSVCSWWADAFHPKDSSSLNDVGPKVVVAIHTHTAY